MPKVGDKDYPYTPVGIENAKADAKRTGKKVEGLPTQNAGERSNNYQLGGRIPGDDNFGMSPEQELRQQMDTKMNPFLPGGQKPAQYEDRPAEYEDGGEVLSAFERNKKRREASKKSKVDQGQYQTGEKGYLTKSGKNQKKIDKLVAKRANVEKGSHAYARIQNRINKLSGSDVRHTGPKKDVKARKTTPFKTKGESRHQTSDKSAFEKNKAARQKAKKSKVDHGKYDVSDKGFLSKEGSKQKKIDNLAKKRDAAPEGSAKRKMFQNRINRLSGSKVRHAYKPKPKSKKKETKVAPKETKKVVAKEAKKVSETKKPKTKGTNVTDIVKRIKKANEGIEARKEKKKLQDIPKHVPKPYITLDLEGAKRMPTEEERRLEAAKKKVYK